MGSVDHVVRCVDVVSSQDHFKDFRLVDVALLHKVDDFVVHCNVLILEVLSLYLELIPQTTLFGHKLRLVFVCKLQIVFSQQVQFIDVDP